MSYSYYVTAHKPTSVICCASGNFTGPHDINLITARSNRLHIDLVTDSSCLVALKEFTINGKIEVMKTFRRDFDECDLLFVVTSRLHAMILSCRKSETGELTIETEAYGSVSDPVGRPSENGMLVIVDPQARLIGLRIYDGLFKIIPLDRDNTELKSTNIRMDELQVHDVQFLHGTTNPTIILIHQDGNGRHIKTHEISLRDKEFIRTPWVHSNTESEASIIIPVAKPTCGALIIGEQSILYNDGITDLAVAPVAFKNTSIVCYVSIPGQNNYILADMNGKLYGLDLKTEERAGSMVASEIHVYRLCETSIADSLTYLGDNQLFIGSKFGNSQFVRLNVDGHACKLEILQSFTNLGPIVDMCVVDLEKQGQNQLVTCSGALKEGSLKIIRNGIGIYENAAIDLPGVKGMWSIVFGEIDCATHNTLVLSFVERTRFLFLIGEEVEMIESECFTTNKRTFLCTNVVHNQIVQITPLSIRLVNQGNKKLAHEWKAMATTAKNISLAAANHTQIVCAYGNELFYLEIVCGELCERGKFTFDFELSCLDITPFPNRTKSDYAVLGLWTDLSVQVLKLPEMRTVHYEKLDGEIIARSILMVTFEKSNYVLCSLGDGTMFYFQMVAASGQLIDRKKVTLGSQPILLKLFRSLASTNVFACSDRPTVIHSLNNKLIFSNVNLKEVNHMCSLNSEAYPDSLALATENLVIIGTIDQIQKLHIRSIPLHETPRRIVHQEETGCFAVITTRVDFQTPKGLKPSRPSASTEALTVSHSTGFGSLGTGLKIASAASSSSAGASSSSSSSGVTVATCSGLAASSLLSSGNRNDSETTVQEVDTSTLIIIDQNTFETLHAHQFVPNEFALSLISCTLANDPNVYFVVGTAVVYPDETEPKIGRLIILQLIDNRLVQITEKEVKGACYSIAEFNGKILVTINSTVRLFEWTAEKELRVECSYFNNTVALYLKRKGEFVLVGDLMRSLTLIQYKQMEGNFEEIGHDTNPNWTTAVEIIDDDLFLAAENAMHLYVCQKDGITSTDDERLIMQTVGRFHLGESVNVFRHGSLVIQDIGNVSDLVSNCILMGTVDGAIGLVAQLQPSLFEFLDVLQTKMAKMIPTIGKIDHGSWRAFSNEFRSEPSCGFIDGDLIESFLDLPYETQKSICDAVTDSYSSQNYNVEQVIRVIEDLTRIH